MLELPLLALLIFLPGLLALRQERQGRQLEDEMTSDMINIKMLSISVPGQPGQDYPILATVPSTSFRSQTDNRHHILLPKSRRPLLYSLLFSCADKIQGRSYADIDAFCQVYHTCSAGENLNNIQFSRLCPNGKSEAAELWRFYVKKNIGTIFDQRGQTCRWWYLVDCQQSEIWYNFVEEEFEEDTNGRS